MKKSIVVLLVLFSNLVLFGQETKTIYKVWHYKVLTTFQKVINQYETELTTVINVNDQGKYVLKILMETLPVRNGGDGVQRIERIDMITDNDYKNGGSVYSAFYSSFSDEEGQGIKNDIQDQDDGSVSSCNEQLGKCAVITKSKDGYFLPIKIARIINNQGDKEITDFVENNNISSHHKG